MHPISIRRIYDAPAAGDGARLLVDRLWPRGVARDRAGLTAWLPDIAPTTALRRWYGHDPARFPEFRRRYWNELAEADGAGRLAPLWQALDSGPVALLTAKKDAGLSHAAVLRDYLVAVAAARRAASDLAARVRGPLEVLLVAVEPSRCRPVFRWSPTPAAAALPGDPSALAPDDLDSLESLCRWAAQGRPLAVADLEADERTLECYAGARSALAAPVTRAATGKAAPATAAAPIVAALVVEGPEAPPKSLAAALGAVGEGLPDWWFESAP